MFCYSLALIPCGIRKTVGRGKLAQNKISQLPSLYAPTTHVKDTLHKSASKKQITDFRQLQYNEKFYGFSSKKKWLRNQIEWKEKWSEDFIKKSEIDAKKELQFDQKIKPRFFKV